MEGSIFHWCTLAPCNNSCRVVPGLIIGFTSVCLFGRVASLTLIHFSECHTTKEKLKKINIRSDSGGGEMMASEHSKGTMAWWPELHIREFLVRLVMPLKACSALDDPAIVEAVLEGAVKEVQVTSYASVESSCWLLASSRCPLPGASWKFGEMHLRNVQTLEDMTWLSVIENNTTEIPISPGTAYQQKPMLWYREGLNVACQNTEVFTNAWNDITEHYEVMQWRCLEAIVLIAKDTYSLVIVHMNFSGSGSAPNDGIFCVSFVIASRNLAAFHDITFA